MRWPALAVLALALGAPAGHGQRPTLTLGEGPWSYATFEESTEIRVSVVTRDLSHPWSLAFLPGTGTGTDRLAMDDALITEREGRVRLLRDGRLGEASIADLSVLDVDQLFDLALHPGFASNGLVYFTYVKNGKPPTPDAAYWATTAVARGRFDGRRLTDIEDVFVADAWHGNRGGDAASLAFGADGALYLSSSHRRDPDAPQRLDTHIGKVLRLNDDGGVPADNPFIGRADVLPEIYSYGHRTVMDLAVHPRSGRLWEAENGPQGGDEVNVLGPGLNFGWPLATHGRDYDGSAAATPAMRAGFVAPEVFWVPSVTIASIAFYTGDSFPAWRNNLFVGAMIEGRIPGTGHLERVVFNEQGEVRRERLLAELRQRIRHVAQGRDGLVYLLTDEDDGALLRIEPWAADASKRAEGADADRRDARPGGTRRDVAAEKSRDVLFAEYDCSACHRIADRSVGPSYLEIASRYDSGDVDALAARIVEGSVGQWGDVPMAAHSGITVAYARGMVREILALPGAR